MTWSRRQVLKTGGALAGVSAVCLLAGRARSLAAAENPVAEAVRGPDSISGQDTEHRVDAPKRIALFNLHTNERLEIEFFRHGVCLPHALAAIEVLLRDFRTGERHTVDPALLHYLADVAHSLRVDPAFSVISGYRSALTNAHLREQSTGVAQHSLHMEGRAIDVRMAGIDCASLAGHAKDLKRGGVGYYRASDFVHLDTGAFRTWRG